ncbi:MAG: tetratricopeptide repeat protein [Geminicoccaceae bacterium]
MASLLPLALLPGAAGAGSACDGLVGAWRWPDGSLVNLLEDFRLEARVAAEAPPVLTGDWWCDPDNRSVVIEWENGLSEIVPLSTDGRRLEGRGREGAVASAAGAGATDLAPTPENIAAAQEAQVDEGLAAYNRGDHVTAYRIWQPIAELGNARAQNNLGALYDQGHGVGLNDAEAVLWFRRSAEQGHRLGQYNLARHLLDGRGVAVDVGEAARLLRLSAEQGHAPAANELGRLHYDGRIAGADDREAVRWFRQAALAGNPWAQFNLGLAYENGRGVLPNLAAAWQRFKTAAETHAPGDAEAAKAAKERVLQRLSGEVPGGITFKSNRIETGNTYDVRATTAYEMLEAGEFRLALFGFNLALAEMEDHGQTPDTNGTLEEVYWGRIEALERLERFAEADATWLELVRVNWWTIVFEPEWALEVLNRLLAQEPDNPDYLALRAEAHAELGDDAARFADTDRRVALETDDHHRADALVERSWAHAALDRPAEALADAEAAVGLEPSPENLGHRAGRHRALGHAAQARDDYTAALGGLAADDWRTKDYRLARAELAAELGDPEAALADLDAVIAAGGGVDRAERDQLALRTELLVTLGLEERAAPDLAELTRRDAGFVETELQPKLEGIRAARQPPPDPGLDRASGRKAWRMGSALAAGTVRHMLTGTKEPLGLWQAAEALGQELGLDVPALPERRAEARADLEAAIVYLRAASDDLSAAMMTDGEPMVAFVFRLAVDLGLLATIHEYGLGDLNDRLVEHAAIDGLFSGVPEEIYQPFLDAVSNGADQATLDAALRELDERSNRFFEG